jgi:hypothetical protein
MKRFVSLRCDHDECTTSGSYVVDTKREEVDLRRRGYLCSRHRRTDEVISLKYPRKTTTLVCVEEPYGRFWRTPGADSGGNGFAHGPGFKAWASDFEPGSRLIVTAVVRAAANPEGGERDLADALVAAEYEREQVEGGYNGRAALSQRQVVALAARVAALEEEIRIREESQIPVIPRGAKANMDRLEARVAALEAVREAAKEAVRRDAVRLHPSDCTGDCNFAPCNCSGEWRFPEATARLVEALAAVAAANPEETP